MMNYEWLGIFKFILVPFLIFDLILKGFALYKSARKEQKVWFIALLIVNSFGILPLIYLLLQSFSNQPAKKKK